MPGKSPDFTVLSDRFIIKGGLAVIDSARDAYEQ